MDASVQIFYPCLHQNGCCGHFASSRWSAFFVRAVGDVLRQISDAPMTQWKIFRNQDRNRFKNAGSMVVESLIPDPCGLWRNEKYSSIKLFTFFFSWESNSDDFNRIACCDLLKRGINKLQATISRTNSIPSRGWTLHWSHGFSG
jgi:hypothetical protein